MSVAQFWEIIERGGPYLVANQVTHLKSIEHQLQGLPPGPVSEFDCLLWQLLNNAYTWPLWGAAWLINHGRSDDGFVYFRAWLIVQGRKVYETALLLPVDLIDVIEQENVYHEFE